MMRAINQLTLPINLEITILENDPVFKLVEICESLDYSKLIDEYVRTWRKYHPATLFELIVLGYMNRMYSSREIEYACKTDTRFMWILDGEEAPDHSTIARFQNERLTPAINDLFYQLIEKLIQLDEVSYTNVFIDGTKLEAYANKLFSLNKGGRIFPHNQGILGLLFALYIQNQIQKVCLFCIENIMCDKSYIKKSITYDALI